MGRTRTEATARVAVQMQKRVLKLLEEEAALVNLERSQFVRQLIGRAMGRVFIERSPRAPARKLFSAPAKGRSLPTVQVDFKVEEPSKAWLVETSHKAGGLSLSAITTLLLLDWCGINPLAQDRDPAD